MTVVQQNQREQRPQPEVRIAQTSQDRAREHGNRTMRIADIAEETLAESERERGDRTRYEDSLQVLSWLVGAPWDERTVDVDRVLHDEHGSLDVAKIAEFIDLILSGRSSLEARHLMLRRPASLADEVRRAAAEAREVAAYQHRFADAPEQPQTREAQAAASRPALPAGAVPPPRNGAELPHREPIAPALPPLYPPAPPELPAESTGHLLQRVRENGHMVTPEQEAAARKDHQFPSASPAAIPTGRIGDTVLMPVSAFFGDEVEPAGDDDAPEPRPFPGAGIADPSAVAGSAKSGADDD